MALWTNNGAIVMNAGGSIVDCAQCPCTPPAGGCCDCGTVRVTLSGFSGPLAALNRSYDLSNVSNAEGCSWIFSDLNALVVTAWNECWARDLETTIALGITIFAFIDPETCLPLSGSWEIRIGLDEIYDSRGGYAVDFSNGQSCPTGNATATLEPDSFSCWPAFEAPATIGVVIESV